VNWKKIAANFFVVFFGTMISVSAVIGYQAYLVALINAVMLAGLAAAKEYYEECGCDSEKIAGLALV
jgi:hypothetical protein